MKKLIYLFICILFSITVKAQFLYDEWGDIIPFSLTDKYKNQINVNEIHSYVLPAYDNDSLCRLHNNGKSLSELGSTFKGGFSIEKRIDIKQIGAKIKLDVGTVWIITIESSTAQFIGATIKSIGLSKGALLSFIQGSDYQIECGPYVYTHDDITSKNKTSGLQKEVYGSKMVIEYFEPKGSEPNDGIIIDQIGYGFVGFNKKKEQSSNLRLKSGVYGTSQYSHCQHDVACTEVNSWVAWALLSPLGV